MGSLFELSHRRPPGYGSNKIVSVELVYPLLTCRYVDWTDGPLSQSCRFDRWRLNPRFFGLDALPWFIVFDPGAPRICE